MDSETYERIVDVENLSEPIYFYVEWVCVDCENENCSGTSYDIPGVILGHQNYRWVNRAFAIKIALAKREKREIDVARSKKNNT